MTKMLRWFGYMLIALLSVLLIGALWLWFASEHKLNARPTAHREQLALPTPAQLADAPRQMQVLGCTDCHGAGMRGTLMIDEPDLARIYAPNVSLIAARASDQQLARAIRQGIGIDGRSLIVMPSAPFSRLTDGETSALIAAIRALPPGGKIMPPREIGLLARIGLATGEFHMEPEELAVYSRELPLDLGPSLAVGRHLVATKCAECHGPALGGAEVEPGVTAPDLTIAGAYDLPAFTKLMRTGVPPGGRRLKMMGSVARAQFSHYTDAEIAAIHAYLVARAQKLGG